MIFSKSNFFKCLRKIGVKSGDSLFIHSDVGLFKQYNNRKEVDKVCAVITKQLQKAVGKNGNLIFPTFTYSFPNKKKYFPKISKSICGYLSEYVKKMKSSISYNDPNVSVVALGKNKKFLTQKPSENAYDKNSFFQRFYNLKGSICNINMDSASTFIHLFERMLFVDYRIDKEFYGYVRKKKKKSKIFVIDKNNQYIADFTKFNLASNKYYKTSNIGRGFVGKISLEKTFEIVKKGLKKDKNFLIKKINIT
jgi:aminoglycoside 3-N-acetyltransferase